MAVPATTQQVLAVHERLARYVHGHFRRKLTIDDAYDIAAEALAEADRATQDGQHILDLEAWLRRAAWRNALDAVRRTEGEGKQPRERPVDLADHVERLADPDPGHQDLLNTSAHATDARALQKAWAALRPEEQRALHLRYFDELDVPDILGVLGCSRHHYDNLVKRGLSKLRKALVADTGDHACRQARTLVLQANFGLLDTAAAAQRDAHLDFCLACRAFARRKQGLIAALPLPAVGLIDRLAARLHGHPLTATELPQHGDTVVGGVALASAGATVSGGAAATASGLIAGSAAKALAVACTAGAVTAGVCTSPGPSATRQGPEQTADSGKQKPKAQPRHQPGAQRAAATSRSAPSITPAAAAPLPRTTTTSAASSKRVVAATTSATRTPQRRSSASATPSSTSREFSAPLASTTSTATQADTASPTPPVTYSDGRPASVETRPATTQAAGSASAAGQEFAP